MFTNILKLRLSIYIFRVLFLLVASFRVKIIISSLSAARRISIVVVLYNFSIPSCLIAFDMLVSRQYTIAKCGSTRLPIIIYLVKAVLFI
jgi:hypothetical protein